VELASDSWATYFRRLSCRRGLLHAAIESVEGRAAVEDRIEALCNAVRIRYPLRTISYTAGADRFEVAVGLDAEHGPVLRYFVTAPRRIFVTERKDTSAILVSDANGARTLVCVFGTDAPCEGRAHAHDAPGWSRTLR
jgi:hypothetical protein